MEQIIPIHALKTQCYQLAQQVSHEHIHLIVTKHGKPILRILPYEHPSQHGLNGLKGTAIWKDDLIDPIHQVWDAACKITDVHS